jgi:hypothetical protein
MSLSYNAVTNVAQNTETNVVAFSTSSTVAIKGFIATGNAPGYFLLRIGSATNGTIMTTYRTSPQDRTAYVIFPDLQYVNGVNAYVNVVNEELDGPHNYEATLIYL